MHADLQLLSRYHEHGDAAAFRELMLAHAGMVFATARRVTRDEAMAQDVAQETFLQLAGESQGVSESVAAWLHRVAWRRACNLIRDDATRRRYESTAAEILHREKEPTWEQVELLIDEALAEMPGKLREPIIEHFLEGRTQQEIATRLAVSQSTVSRGIDNGVIELRSRLKSKGLICGAGLAGLMSAHAAQAAPASLSIAIGKLALSGLGATAPSMTAAKSALGWLLHPVTLPAALLLGAAVLFISSSLPPALPSAVPAQSPASLPATPLPETAWPQPQQWDGKILCQTCALRLTPSRFGVFIHEENGVQVIYQLRGAVPRLHETYCPLGQPGAAHATGTPDNEAGLKILKLQTLQPLP